MVEADLGLAGGATRGAGVDIGGAERLAHDPLEQIALLVGGVADDRGGCRAAGLQRRGGLGDRVLPARLNAAAQAWAAPPLPGVEHLEAVAAAVAEPAVVDLGVVAADDPLHLLVADGE